MKKQITQFALLLCSLLILSACTNTYLPFERPLKVQQGNVITPAMISQLKKGMTKNQVSFIMGTAVLENTFDEPRWDYIYTYQVGNHPMEIRRVSVYFDKKDKVSRIDQDNITDKEHAIPSSYTKKTEKSSKNSSITSDKSSNNKSAASDAGKPQIKGSNNAKPNNP